MKIMMKTLRMKYQKDNIYQQQSEFHSVRNCRSMVTNLAEMQGMFKEEAVKLTFLSLFHNAVPPHVSSREMNNYLNHMGLSNTSKFTDNRDLGNINTNFHGLARVLRVPCTRGKDELDVYGR